MTTRTYSTREAAHELGISEDLIAKWRHRGRITPVQFITGRGRGGLVPLYDLDQLRPLAEQHHRRRRTRKDPTS